MNQTKIQDKRNKKLSKTQLKKKQEIEQDVNQGMNYFNDLKLQGEEQINKCQQTIQDAKANLEKQINHQIEQQKEKAKKFGQEAFSQLSQLANSRESYLEFRNDSIEFKFDIPLLDEWKICRFLTLSDCNLQFSNIEKELIIDLKGKIQFLDIQFPEFFLQFSLQKPPIIFFDKKPLVKGFDPIQYGLNQTNIFPTINQIDIFQFNFENQEFESQFSFNTENSQEKSSFINFSTISMRIQYKQQLVKQKLNSDIQAMLKTSILLFGLKINLNLDFSFLATNYRTNSSLRFVLESEPIENFCLNKFVQHILSFEIPSHIAEFKIKTIMCKLSIEKSKQWEFFFLLTIEDGSCNFFQNLIIIKALTGQLIYNKESGWDDSSIRGECIVKNQSLGSFKFGFLKDRNQIQADLIPNKAFSLEKLFYDLSGCDLKMSIFQEINFQNLTLMLEIFESQMLFKAIYKKNNLKFDNFSFIQLKDVNVEFQLINKQVISKNLQIDFKIVLFNNQKFVIEEKQQDFHQKLRNLFCLSDRPYSHYLIFQGNLICIRFINFNFLKNVQLKQNLLSTLILI
ncbi:unnamed protein product [Paramecium primaurelia]|uniref:Uncharacterized protein n=1 Tax=Paramecium primaurelia TaxID=5886 RepID=A0A8S1PMC8_PARPR|nr:unnamed protein product [Paramecium primaurelia]